jgi:hypothetical protein
MTLVEVDLLTDQGNGAVLRLPDRSFPGVLVQGDTLSHYLSTVAEVIEVTAGQVVGRLATPQSQGSYYAPSGALAPYSTGPHGHLELRLNGRVIDPATVFGPTFNRSGTFELSRDAFFRPSP